MSAYDWLLFDADGTLFDFHSSEAVALQRAFVAAGVEYAPEYLETFRTIQAELWHQVEQGHLTAPIVRLRRFERLLGELALASDPAIFDAEFIRHLAHGTELYPAARPVLEALRPAYRLALASNGLAHVQQTRLRLSGLDTFFEQVFISEAVGASKPSPAFFAAALAGLGQPDPARVLMIGDSLTADIGGAAAAGLGTCWTNYAGQPRPAEVRIDHEMSSLSDLLPLLLPHPAEA